MASRAHRFDNDEYIHDQELSPTEKRVAPGKRTRTHGSKRGPYDLEPDHLRQIAKTSQKKLGGVGKRVAHYYRLSGTDSRAVRDLLKQSPFSDYANQSFIQAVTEAAASGDVAHSMRDGIHSVGSRWIGTQWASTCIALLRKGTPSPEGVVADLAVYSTSIAAFSLADVWREQAKKDPRISKRQVNRTSRAIRKGAKAAQDNAYRREFRQFGIGRAPQMMPAKKSTSNDESAEKQFPETAGIVYETPPQKELRTEPRKLYTGSNPDWAQIKQEPDYLRAHTMPTMRDVELVSPTPGPPQYDLDIERTKTSESRSTDVSLTRQTDTSTMSASATKKSTYESNSESFDTKFSYKSDNVRASGKYYTEKSSKRSRREIGMGIEAGDGDTQFESHVSLKELKGRRETKNASGDIKFSNEAVNVSVSGDYDSQIARGGKEESGTLFGAGKARIAGKEVTVELVHAFDDREFRFSGTDHTQKAAQSFLRLDGEKAHASAHDSKVKIDFGKEIDLFAPSALPEMDSFQGAKFGFGNSKLALAKFQGPDVDMTALQLQHQTKRGTGLGVNYLSDDQNDKQQITGQVWHKKRFLAEIDVEVGKEIERYTGKVALSGDHYKLNAKYESLNDQATAAVRLGLFKNEDDFDRFIANYRYQYNSSLDAMENHADIILRTSVGQVLAQLQATHEWSKAGSRSELDLLVENKPIDIYGKDSSLLLNSGWDSDRGAYLGTGARIADVGVVVRFYQDGGAGLHFVLPWWK